MAGGLRSVGTQRAKQARGIMLRAEEQDERLRPRYGVQRWTHRHAPSTERLVTLVRIVGRYQRTRHIGNSQSSVRAVCSFASAQYGTRMRHPRLTIQRVTYTSSSAVPSGSRPATSRPGNACAEAVSLQHVHAQCLRAARQRRRAAVECSASLRIRSCAAPGMPRPARFRRSVSRAAAAAGTCPRRRTRGPRRRRAGSAGSGPARPRRRRRRRRSRCALGPDRGISAGASWRGGSGARGWSRSA